MFSSYFYFSKKFLGTSDKSIYHVKNRHFTQVMGDFALFLEKSNSSAIHVKCV